IELVGHSEPRLEVVVIGIDRAAADIRRRIRYGVSLVPDVLSGFEYERAAAELVYHRRGIIPTQAEVQCQPAADPECVLAIEIIPISVHVSGGVAEDAAC